MTRTPHGHNNNNNADADAGYDEFLAGNQFAAEQIFLIGWSNGGSATLSTLANNGPVAVSPFERAIALYPGCGLQGEYSYANTGNLLILHSDADSVTPIDGCIERVDESNILGNNMTLMGFAGREHQLDYDEGATDDAIQALRQTLIHFLK